MFVVKGVNGIFLGYTSKTSRWSRVLFIGMYKESAQSTHIVDAKII